MCQSVNRRRGCLQLGLALLLLSLALSLICCAKPETPLSPEAAAFKKEVRTILDNLAPVLAGPLSRNDGDAARQAILTKYPAAGQGKDEFPFWVGAMNKDGILLTTLPPVAAIGADFAKYDLVRQTLSQGRVHQKELYGSHGEPLYLIVAPVRAQGKVVGLVGLRLTAAEAAKKWGIGEKEFPQMDLN